MVSEVQKFPFLMMQELDTYDSALCKCFSVNRQPSKVLDFQFSYVCSNDVSIATTVDDSLSVEENERESVKTTIRYEYT